MEFKKALETLSDSKLSRVFMLNGTAYVEGTGKRIKIDGGIPFEGTINTQAIWYATMVYPEAKRTIEAACLKVSEEREKLKVEMKINVHSTGNGKGGARVFCCHRHRGNETSL